MHVPVFDIMVYTMVTYEYKYSTVMQPRFGLLLRLPQSTMRSRFGLLLRLPQPGGLQDLQELIHQLRHMSMATASIGDAVQSFPAPEPTANAEALSDRVLTTEEVEDDEPAQESANVSAKPNTETAAIPSWPAIDIGGERKRPTTSGHGADTPVMPSDQHREPSIASGHIADSVMGAIRFPASRATPSLWARVPMSTWHEGSTAGCSGTNEGECSYMLTACTQMMKMKPPDAIISVLARPVPSRPLSSAAQPTSASIRSDTSTVPSLAGLRRAAERMGAWVTTRGLRGRAVSAVGLAMKNSSSPCIGVAPWAAVLDNALLAQKAGKVHQYAIGVSASYASATPSSLHARERWHRAAEQTTRLMEGVKVLAGIQALEATATLPEEEMRELESLEPLDASHTHFLFLDTKDGGERRSAGERGIELFARCALESYISNADANNDGIETPLLVLVIGGDEHTLQIVLEYLRGDHPIVVLAASGVAPCARLPVACLQASHARYRMLECIPSSSFAISASLPSSRSLRSEKSCSMNPAHARLACGAQCIRDAAGFHLLHAARLRACAGGSAEDICRYCQKGELPSPEERNAEYLSKATRLLPMIAKLGQRTGFNTTPLLTIFDHGADQDAAGGPSEGSITAAARDPASLGEQLEMVLLHSAVNNCKTRVDQLRFSVTTRGTPNALFTTLSYH